MTVIVYGVDQQKGIEAYQWSGALEEVLEFDYGLTEQQLHDLRHMGVGDSVLIHGADGACHRVKCVGLDAPQCVLTLVH